MPSSVVPDPRLIASPPRAGRWSMAATVLVCLTLAASGLVGRAALAPATVALALAVVAALRARDAVAIHLSVVALLANVTHCSLGQWWPAPTILTLAIYGTALLASRQVRTGAGWLRRGMLDRSAGLVLGVFVAGEAIALVLWRFATSADLDRFRPLVPDVPLWMIPLGIVGFAVINAAYEELLWRGLVQHALEAATGSRWAAWLLQGLGFALWHFEGFPSGPVGAALAGVFALMMGYLRLRCRGMLAPLLGHVCADVTIFTLVAVMVLR